MSIKIGKHQVGEGHPVFIVAEIGSNWTTLEDCMTSIALAKQCGADAVKFQAYTSEALYGREIYEGKLATDPGPYKPVPIAGTLPLEWLPKLAEKAKACDIEFMCSAFSPELVEVVDPYVNAHKVASAELTHLRILQKLRELGKPVILSTGASGESDIRMALSVLQGPGDTMPCPVVLMYCVAAYPARVIEFGKLFALKEFNTPVGYSDHSTDILCVPRIAVASGACVIEKHVNFVGANGPDSPHSLSTDEFKIMVDDLRGVCRDQIVTPSKEETPMILRHNRRIIATRDIQPGEALKEGVNMGIYRSLKDDTKAAHPFMIDHMDGKLSRRFIPAGDGIAPGDV